ncbi:hypothetical protein [Streptomyces sp. NPDC006335]|uniref:hypothetical protein n=1 Tax=Streptomyces sp. NPDC006335 TaxID=3156895 RepID=UPI00339F4BFE
MGCAADDECEGKAWAPAYNVSDLLRALTGELMNDPDVYCTVRGPHQDDGPEADLEAHGGLEAHYADTVHA